ncbi:MAG: motility protein A [Synergistales bacterium]
MDPFAVLSFAATIAVVLGAIVMGGSPEAFVNIPSVLITIGGTLGAIAVATPKEELRKLPKTLRSAFARKKEQDLLPIMRSMIELSRKARAEGLLALEEEVNRIEDGFIRKSTQLVIDGTPPELVQSIMEAEISLQEEQGAASRRVFDLMAELAPAFGMLGTLIGLIQMLRHLDSPDALGPGMAVALITTLYGSFIANVFAIPVSRKLANLTAEKVKFMEVIVEGILAIQAGENPRIVEEKLKVFLPSEKRDFLKPASRTAKEEADGKAPAAGSRSRAA